MSAEMSVIHRQHTEMYSPFWQLKKNFYEMLVALATVSVAISSPESIYFNQELWQVSFLLKELNIG